MSMWMLMKMFNILYVYYQLVVLACPRLTQQPRGKSVIAKEKYLTIDP